MSNIVKAYKNWPSYDDDLVNKIYVDTLVDDLANGDMASLKRQVQQNTQDISTNTNDIYNLGNTKLDTSVYDTFKSTEYNPLVVKVDGKIESYYQNTDPSVNWITGLEKNSHVGDIWYDTTTQKTFVYYKDTSTSPVSYHWQWQNVPFELIDSVNGKATMYSGVVPTNYKAGDYWIIPLDCYSNTYSLTSQSGEFSAGMVIQLGNYEFTIDTVDAYNAIDTYHMNVPATSNYNISDVITSENIEVTVTSSSSFAMPTNCYGGSIAVATSDGTSYSSSDWINRNSDIPSDKASTYALNSDLEYSVNNWNSELFTVNSNLSKEIDDNKKDAKDYIDGLDTRLSKLIGDNYDDLDGQINNPETGLNKKLIDLDDKYDDIINNPVEGVKAKMQILEDRIVAYIRGTGGNNLLRNSVGFRNQKYWDLIDSNTKIEQTYRTYAGKLITVNMRYKKPNTTNAKISLGYYIGNTFTEVYELLNTSENIADWSELVFSYESSINNPVIRFSSTFTGVQDNDAEANGASGSKLVFNNGLIVTDLMIGYGEQQPWTPYFDEVYGKTYNIDKEGFDIREAASDKNMHLDTNSIDFRTANNTVEAVFSKAETITDNMTSNNSINIGNLNMIKYDNNNIIEY